MQWTVIGHGGIARAFARAVHGLEGHTIGTVVGRSAERAQRFAAEHGVQRATEDLEDGVAQSDAVYVATPHPAHAHAVRAALSAGVPVLCEKPMTLTAADTKALVEAARASGVFLMEAVWTRFLPVYDQVRAWLANGAIGPIRGLSARFGFHRQYDPAHRLFDPRLGGGALYDIGIYPLHVAGWLLGEPSELVGRAALCESGVDDYVSVVGSYGDVHVELAATTRVALDSRAIVWGERGWIEIPQFWKAQEATLHADDQAETHRAPFDINGYEYEIREVARCLEAGLLESPRLPWHVSVAIAEQVDDLLEQIHA